METITTVLVTEIENIHTGKLDVSRNIMMFPNEESKKEYKQKMSKNYQGMEMRSNYRLSRLYYTEPRIENGVVYSK